MNENRNNNGAAGGIGFCGLLAIAFIVLKLTGFIDWSWLWVLAPLWIPVAIFFAVALVILIVVLVKMGVEQTEERRHRQEHSRSTDEVEEDKLRRLLARINSWKESKLRRWMCEQEREAADEVLRIAKEEGGAPDE